MTLLFAQKHSKMIQIHVDYPNSTCLISGMAF